MPGAPEPVVRAERFVRRLTLRNWILVGLIALVVLFFALVDLSPDLSALDHGIASGSATGNYHARAAALSAAAEAENGELRVVETAGSVDNIRRLSAGCDVAYGLVQEGLDWPAGRDLALIGALPQPEAVLFLARDASAWSGFADLRATRIGIGPDGSGTAAVARRLFGSEDFDGLGLELVTGPFAEQVDQVRRGDLDLAMAILDPHAAVVRTAVRSGEIELVSFPHLAPVTARLGVGRVGRIAAGTYDSVRVLPAVDVAVVEIDTLVVSNQCASRSADNAVLTLLSQEEPRFLAVNRGRTNLTGLELAGTAVSFYDNGGVTFVERFLPWLTNIMPLANWVYVIMALSILGNVSGFLHRWQLYRVDARRNALKGELMGVFGPGLQIDEIEALQPTAAQRTDQEIRPQLDALIAKAEALLERCRRVSVNLLVPMGAEIHYRFQEGLIEAMVDALVEFRSKLDQPGPPTSG